MPKPVRLRQRGAADIDAALDHLLIDVGAAVAERFVDQLERALQRLGRHPQIGSLRFSYELDIPELRAWPMTSFPYLIFYVERHDEVDAWRILHTRRDIPTSLGPHDPPQVVDAGGRWALRRALAERSTEACDDWATVPVQLRLPLIQLLLVEPL